jgi:hypothetical protein
MSSEHKTAPYLLKTHETYLDKITLIQGGAYSGKTTIVKEILRLVSGFVPNYLIVTPGTSYNYYRERYPHALIKHNLTKDDFKQIWESQPNTIVVIDGCDEQLKEWTTFCSQDEKNPYCYNFLYNKPIHMTVVITAHDENHIPPGLRHNINNIIYTTEQALFSSINRISNRFTREERILAEAIAREIFADGEIHTHMKLCYIRTREPPFMITIADDI